MPVARVDQNRFESELAWVAFSLLGSWELGRRSNSQALHCPARTVVVVPYLPDGSLLYLLVRRASDILGYLGRTLEVHRYLLYAF